MQKHTSVKRVAEIAKSLMHNSNLVAFVYHGLLDIQNKLRVTVEGISPTVYGLSVHCSNLAAIQSGVLKRQVFIL